MLHSMETRFRRPARVFLSGGTHGDWQGRVQDAVQGVEWFDPRSVTGGVDMRPIAQTERGWLDQSDLVLFYFEHNNPSGLGSAFEVGYSVARGLPVIFVDEKRTSHSEWLAVHCTYVTHSLEDGIRILKTVVGSMELVRP